MSDNSAETVHQWCTRSHGTKSHVCNDVKTGDAELPKDTSVTIDSTSDVPKYPFHKRAMQKAQQFFTNHVSMYSLAMILFAMSHICAILFLPDVFGYWKPYSNVELPDNSPTRKVGKWAISSIKSNGFFVIGEASKQLQTPNPIYVPDSSHVWSIVKYYEDHSSEQFVIKLIMKILKGVCTTEPRPVIVDSGANEGIISAISASMGCAVLSVEPQLGCVGLLNQTKIRNGFTRQKIVNKLLSEFPISITTDAEVCIGSKMILPDGTVSNTNHGMKASQAMEKLAKVKATTTSIRLDELINSDSQIVALWHIDVEGAEIMVLRSAKKLFEKKQIHRVILEVGPQRWGNFGLKVKDGLKELRQLFQNWDCSTQEFGAYAFEKQLPDIPDVYCVAPWATAL